MKSSLNRILLCFLVPVICVQSRCNEQQQNIPYVPVDFSVNVNLPAYIDLSVPSGHVLVNGGSQGIVLYRYTLDQFVALDRHATADISSNCQVEVAADGLILTDPCGDSEWLIIDGSVVSGSATLSRCIVTARNGIRPFYGSTTYNRNPSHGACMSSCGLHPLNERGHQDNEQRRKRRLQKSQEFVRHTVTRLSGDKCDEGSHDQPGQTVHHHQPRPAVDVSCGFQEQAIQGEKDDQNKNAQSPLEALQLIQTHAVKAIPCSLHDVVMDPLGLRIDIPPLLPQLRGH